MTQRKCDVCHHVIPKKSPYIDVSAYRLLSFQYLDMCMPCAGPIVQFLKKNNLLNIEKKSALETKSKVRTIRG